MIMSTIYAEIFARRPISPPALIGKTCPMLKIAQSRIGKNYFHKLFLQYNRLGEILSHISQGTNAVTYSSQLIDNLKSSCSSTVKERVKGIDYASTTCNIMMLHCGAHAFTLWWPRSAMHPT